MSGEFSLVRWTVARALVGNWCQRAGVDIKNWAVGFWERRGMSMSPCSWTVQFRRGTATCQEPVQTHIHLPPTRRTQPGCLGGPLAYMAYVYVHIKRPGCASTWLILFLSHSELLLGWTYNSTVTVTCYSGGIVLCNIWPSWDHFVQFGVTLSLLLLLKHNTGDM